MYVKMSGNQKLPRVIKKITELETSAVILICICTPVANFIAL